MLLTCLIHKWPFSKVPCFFCKGDVHFQWDLLHPQSDALQLTKAVGRTWEVAEYHNWFFWPVILMRLQIHKGKKSHPAELREVPFGESFPHTAWTLMLSSLLCEHQRMCPLGRRQLRMGVLPQLTTAVQLQPDPCLWGRRLTAIYACKYLCLFFSS